MKGQEKKQKANPPKASKAKGDKKISKFYKEGTKVQ